MAMSLPEVVAAQRGVVIRRQLLIAGWTDGQIAAQLGARRWKRVYPGVYATFTGEPSWDQRVLAALLACGDGAVAGFQTAAALHGFGVRGKPLRIVVPASRRLTPPPGVVLTRSRALGENAVLGSFPPRTRVERTAIDLVDEAVRVDVAFAWLAGAVQQRCTTAARLHGAVELRRNIRHRREVLLALSDIAAGVHTELERRWLRIEQKHQLPPGRRQVGERGHGSTRWLDCDYDPYRVRVELDGRLGHDEVSERWRDLRRDNSAVVAGHLPLRFGWADLLTRGCVAAGQVATVLLRAGWPDRPRRCGASCEFPLR